MAAFEEVVAGIQAIVSDLAEGKITEFNDDTLSKLGVKLSAYNATLGTSVAQLARSADIAETQYDYQRKIRYKEIRDSEELTEEGKKIKISQEDAKAEADLSCEELKKKWLDAKHAHLMAKILREDTANLVSTIQSRIKTLTNERFQS